MSIPLSALIIEDSVDDTDLLLRELHRGGYEVKYIRVEDARAMQTALNSSHWDVILSDHSMPHFSGLAALEILKESGLDLPFIIISGTMGEETAVNALKAGAHDFIVKGRLARLIPAIGREMRESVIRADRRRAIADLHEAIRVRDDFLTIASHELKTPITSLELQVGSALRTICAYNEKRVETLPVEKLASQLAASTQQIHRLTSLINTLLDVTRITAGKLTLNRKQVDLRDLVQTVIAHHRDALRRIATSSEIIVDANESVVGSWDPLTLETVVGNLLSNASKFGENKPVHIRIEKTPQFARLSVRDQGIGIDPDKQERIFQRFERAVSSQNYGGFGIGLWVVRQVVEAHGGHIQVESKKGSGSTFTIELPLNN